MKPRSVLLWEAQCAFEKVHGRTAFPREIAFMLDLKANNQDYYRKELASLGIVKLVNEHNPNGGKQCRVTLLKQCAVSAAMLAKAKACPIMTQEQLCARKAAAASGPRKGRDSLTKRIDEVVMKIKSQGAESVERGGFDVVLDFRQSLQRSGMVHATRVG